jgi:hypothetical protein
MSCSQSELPAKPKAVATGASLRKDVLEIECAEVRIRESDLSTSCSSLNNCHECTELKISQILYAHPSSDTIRQALSSELSGHCLSITRS